MHQMTEAEKMLKGATFYVCRELGGYEAAASYVKIGKSQLERCASQHYPEQFINIATAVALDLAIGQSVLANCMAAQFKRESQPELASVTDVHQVATKELSEFLFKFTSAIENNDIDVKEGRELRKEGQDVINAVYRTFELCPGGCK